MIVAEGLAVQELNRVYSLRQALFDLGRKEFTND